MIFGRRLKELRLNRGFTQEDMEYKLGMNRANISNYERDVALPPADTLIKIADIFNVSTDYLLGREKDDDESPSYWKERALKTENELAKLKLGLIDLTNSFRVEG